MRETLLTVKVEEAELGLTSRMSAARSEASVTNVRLAGPQTLSQKWLKLDEACCESSVTPVNRYWINSKDYAPSANK